MILMISIVVKIMFFITAFCFGIVGSLGFRVLGLGFQGANRLIDKIL